jgi:hypothetical protein
LTKLSKSGNDLATHSRGGEEVMPRQARLDGPGTLHHVVIRGIEKGRIVQDDQDQKHFVS